MASELRTRPQNSSLSKPSQKGLGWSRVPGQAVQGPQALQEAPWGSCPFGGPPKSPQVSRGHTMLPFPWEPSPLWFEVMYSVIIFLNHHLFS